MTDLEHIDGIIEIETSLFFNLGFFVHSYTNLNELINYDSNIYYSFKRDTMGHWRLMVEDSRKIFSDGNSDHYKINDLIRKMRNNYPDETLYNMWVQELYNYKDIIKKIDLLRMNFFAHLAPRRNCIQGNKPYDINIENFIDLLKKTKNITAEMASIIKSSDQEQQTVNDYLKAQYNYGRTHANNLMINLDIIINDFNIF